MVIVLFSELVLVSVFLVFSSLLCRLLNSIAGHARMIYPLDVLPHYVYDINNNIVKGAKRLLSTRGIIIGATDCAGD